MLLIRFLEKHKDNFLPKILLDKKVEDEYAYWYPILMGVATKEEIKWADAEQLQFFNAMAEEKFKLQQIIAEGVQQTNE